MSLKTIFTALGDQVRRLTGRSDKMSVAVMTDALAGITLGVDASGLTASASDVIGDKVFIGSSGGKQTGTMVNNGAVNVTLDASTKTYSVPAGYHNGNGKVQVVTQTKSVTPGASIKTVYPDSGKLLSAVTVGAVSGGKKTGYFVGNSSKTRTIDVGVTLSNTDTFFLWCSASATSFYGAVIDVWCYGSSDTNLRYTDSSGVLKNPEYDGVTYSGSTVTITSKNGSFLSGYKYEWMLVQG